MDPVVSVFVGSYNMYYVKFKERRSNTGEVAYPR
jgi:hypothetical protein